MRDNENRKGVSRRTLLGTTAAAAGVGFAGGVALTKDGKSLVTAADAQTKRSAPAWHVPLCLVCRIYRDQYRSRQ